jgi:choline dehydrogenase-like flavoprotein
VILAGGAFGTPSILLHSGIGPADELAALGVEPLVDLPDVGKNLQEHPATHLTFKFNVSDTAEAYSNSPTLAGQQLQLWRANHTGFHATGPINNIAWIRTPEDSSIWEAFQDPSLGPDSPHNEIHIWNGAPFDVLPDDGSYVTLGVSVMSPLSGKDVPNLP